MTDPRPATDKNRAEPGTARGNGRSRASGSAGLELDSDVVGLTRALCDLESVSGQEKALADAVEEALRRLPHLEVLRDGDAVVARTALGRRERVVLAGHLDTVPVAGNLPCRLEGQGDDALLYGRGTSDMKAGVAVALRLAATLPEPNRDITFVFYDNEEVEAAANGLGRLVREHPDWLTGDFAVLGEPTSGVVEGGCNGTIRVEVTIRGVAAHSARSWLGRNAVHEAGVVLDRLRTYLPRVAEVDGLLFREGLNAVRIRGGVAGNVIPDECVVTVNYRFAPDRYPDEAADHLRTVFNGYEVTVVDSAAGARPGLDHPAAAAFVAAIGRAPAPKQGWTDVARFAELGIPAVNYGPGDPTLAHRDDEHCKVALIRECERALRAWLTA
ncbi:MAG TPA: succinyl-diaminopimelate desuccinylase [Kineosporiaceae bacterium]|nr:succinyl-diaminopimelate desuccinylase [Kineosporiaceae bacterium]